jgi:hypothetical protein
LKCVAAHRGRANHTVTAKKIVLPPLTEDRGSILVWLTEGLRWRRAGGFGAEQFDAASGYCVLL